VTHHIGLSCYERFHR